MNQTEFEKVMDSAIADAKKILCKKGQDYTRVGSDDRLDNFKSIGAITGLSPLQVWAVLISKQFLALMQYVSAGKLHSESVEERFSDTLNYLFLGRAIIAEQISQAQKQTQDKERYSFLRVLLDAFSAVQEPEPKVTRKCETEVSEPGVQVIKNLTESPYPSLETVEPKPVSPATPAAPADQVTVFAV